MSFDSRESQFGNLNKFTKILEPILDISPFLFNNYSDLSKTRSINPNITFDTNTERELQQMDIQGLSSTKNIEKRLKRFAINGEESHTVMKFIDKSHDKDLNTVLQSKYIFSESKNVDFYESKYEIDIPAIGIKDI